MYTIYFFLLHNTLESHSTLAFFAKISKHVWECFTLVFNWDIPFTKDHAKIKLFACQENCHDNLIPLLNEDSHDTLNFRVSSSVKMDE